MANGLDVLADEEYLTISTTAASPAIDSTSFLNALIPPTPFLLPPSPPPYTSPLRTTKSPPPLAQPTKTSTNNGWNDGEEEEDEEYNRRVHAQYIIFTMYFNKIVFDVLRHKMSLILCLFIYLFCRRCLRSLS